MFEHTAMLLSFVYALALTHLLSSVTDLIAARARVRLSGVLVMWMLIAFEYVFMNWLQIWPLREIGHWSLIDVTLLFAMAVLQYFTCSLVSMKVDDDGPVDMAAFLQRQKPAFLLAFAGLIMLAMALNYRERDQSVGLSQSAWVGENLVCLAMLGVLALAAFARAARLQWFAAAAMLATGVVLFVLYTPLG